MTETFFLFKEVCLQLSSSLQSSGVALQLLSGTVKHLVVMVEWVFELEGVGEDILSRDGHHFFVTG